MKIELTQMEEKKIPEFKGGEKAFATRMFDDGSAKIMRGRLEPGASIGLHKHEGNSEIIFVLQGEGTMLYDGEIEVLRPGDAHYCPEGHTHSFLNKGVEDLVFYACVPEVQKSVESQSQIAQNASEKATEADISDSATKPAEGKEAYAFVDGSYNAATGVYGFGGFVAYEGKRELIQGAGKEPEMASMRNVAGEVLGSTKAIEKAIELGITKLTIYYDYMGIEMWATGAWKRNKKGTIAYYDYVQSVKNVIELQFVKVKGHSGVEGNEIADKLAKEAVMA